MSCRSGCLRLFLRARPRTAISEKRITISAQSYT
ncbi:hypothetical protein AvCA_27510 [Azotobacter vinelandii CA]|uniref:Uncharacterized protein n=2 Tax=Azotobacter vinelandii TaxID=354 RepID=C1DKS3_AZOVD|nr:hypothetical protein Avin_27510 [Azotobacter vinelandii DJ]AGK16555.1 hypothetical protein AvCA_27510 [Azotobacter vinelandii CA]AGK20851.1 hypothetical protein AvCA6_27510 [Azotobacter vinelandii CA6]